MNVGILGGGQLGRMLALAAYPLGITCRVFDPSADCSAGRVTEHVHGEYEDYQALYRFSQGLDVITYEFENVPLTAVRWLAERCRVYPPPEALEVAQDRYYEKTYLKSKGLPVPPFAAIDTRAELEQAVSWIGLPAVLKTRRYGYDGKGQRLLHTQADVEAGWNLLQGRPLILETFVSFDRELSLVAVRGRDGCRVDYPLVENEHSQGMLRRTRAPASTVEPTLQEQAENYASRLMNDLDYVGVLAIEWFACGNLLWANEIAPRVHNSGHWTIEGSETSQFENHMRAVCELPLGMTGVRGVSEMVNLIGMLPAREAICGLERAHYHVYGKPVRPQRKVGHITIRADSRDDCDRIVIQLLSMLEDRG